MAELRVALSGCGRIAERGYLPALGVLEDVRLVAIADPAVERCTRLAPDVPAFASLAELLTETEPDAVLVASPAAFHVADAAAAAAAGLPALVEKPPGRTAAEAERLTRLEPAPWLGLNRRFDTRLAKLALPEGGRLRLTFVSGWDAHEPEPDLLLDLGPHLVDLAQRLAGQARRVTCRRREPGTWHVELDLERGAAELTLGLGTYVERYEVLDAAGAPAGGYVAGRSVERLRDRLRPPARRPLAASLARQLEAFAAAVRGEPPDELAHAEEGVGLLLVLDAARASAERGGAPVELV